MPPRILATGLGGAALYAGVLGAPAMAESPPPAVTATATATPAAPVPTPSAPPNAATGVATPAAAATPAAPSAPNTASGTAGAGRSAAPARPAGGAPPTGGANVAAGTGDARRPTPQPHHRAAHHAPAASHAPAAPAPALSFAVPGVVHAGVPDFFIDRFRIPPFLLPIYQAAGMQYGIRWEVLAAINEIETDYGRNLNISSAGAVGWMQFMPATWKSFGVDANRDGRSDPFNPVDAIFAAARYLHAAGAGTDLRRAIFSYNHASWYVDSVLARAQAIGAMPSDLVGSVTGLAQGRFPIGAPSSYPGRGGNEISISARAGAPVVAVNDARVLAVGKSRPLGRFVVLRDVYGNTFSYGKLGRIARVHQRRRLARGTRLTSGTVFGRLGSRGNLVFAIRPAGRGAPQIDPRPILAGWKLLEATAAYRVAPENGLSGGEPSIGQIMLMSQAALTRAVLASPLIGIYPCGREDIRTGQIDRRVLATMLYLAESGLRPTISALKCGHSVMTASGNVSEHSTGTAMDISAINGSVISPATQGPGSITDVTIRRLLTLQGVMKPHQIISLMTFDGTDNTLAMGDHADHIHVGWRALYGRDPRAARQVDATLRPHQWVKLIDRLRVVGNPALRQAPSRYSLRLARRAHRGE